MPLIDRQPWALELYALQDKWMVPIGVSRLDTGQLVSSGTLPLTFRLVNEESQAKVEVVHTTDGQSWRF